MNTEIIGMIADLVLITILIIDIVVTVKLSKHYKTNTKACEYLFKCWEKEGVLENDDDL